MRNPILTKSSCTTVFLFVVIGAFAAGCGGESMSAEPASDYASPVVAGRLEADDIKESSGLTASECQDVLWTHNDAGNGPFIFAMSPDGKHLGTWRVENAANVDWESIATFKDSTGKCFLIIG